jgi:hypothetical protein
MLLICLTKHNIKNYFCAYKDDSLESNGKALSKLSSEGEEHTYVDYMEGKEKLRHFTVRRLYTARWESECKRMNSVPDMEQ